MQILRFFNKKESRQFHNRQDLTTSSYDDSSDKTKIHIKPIVAKELLDKLSEKYKGVRSSYGFLSDLNASLGLREKEKSSNYYELNLNNNDSITIRISNHNAKGSNSAKATAAVQTDGVDIGTGENSQADRGRDTGAGNDNRGNGGINPQDSEIGIRRNNSSFRLTEEGENSIVDINKEEG